MSPRVAICIVTFGNPQDVRRCLDALEAAEYSDFEVILCENGGRSAYTDLAAWLPRTLQGGQPVRAVLADGNLGYAGGVNRCIRETAGADAWWVLNPDTAPAPGALTALVARLGRNDCDAVGSTVVLPDGTVQSNGGRWRRLLARAVSLGYGSPVGTPVDATAVEARQNYLNGASMLVSRRFVDQAGLMREEYFLYCEEVEWCLRALSRGLRLGYAPDALVWHEQGTSTGNRTDLKSRSRLSVYLNERNRLLLTRDCDAYLFPIAATSALLLMLLRFGRARAWWQLLHALEGWWAGIRNERGMPPVAPATAGASAAMTGPESEH